MSFALKVINISKSFPGVLANDKINIEIPSGTIHAIVGENGAGKSTLMKIIYGMISPDSGKISVSEKEKNLVLQKMRLKQGLAWFISILCWQII